MRTCSFRLQGPFFRPRSHATPAKQLAFLACFYLYGTSPQLASLTIHRSIVDEGRKEREANFLPAHQTSPISRSYFFFSFLSVLPAGESSTSSSSSDLPARRSVRHGLRAENPMERKAPAKSIRSSHRGRSDLFGLMLPRITYVGPVRATFR